MITAIKLIVMLTAIVLLSYPFISVKGKLRKFFVASSLRYYSPHNRKNIFFVILSLLEYIAFVFVFRLLNSAASFLANLPVLGNIFVKTVAGFNSHIDYIVFAIKLVLVNLIAVYAFIFLKSFIKKFFINPIFGIGKKRERPKLFGFLKRNRKSRKSKKKNKNKNKNTLLDQPTDTEEEENEPEQTEELRKRRRIPDFLHTRLGDDQEEDEEGGEKPEEKDKKRPKRSRFARFLLDIFFEGDEFQYAKGWVIRARAILQNFVRLAELLYLLFITVVLASVFFALPLPVYNVLINVMHVDMWYMYPAISIIFLQEICNVFNTLEKEEKAEDPELEAERKEDRKKEARIRALLAELKKRFDSEHSMRFYPELPSEELPEYECTNVTYANALEYIRKQMRSSSGRVVQSYMECLDAIYSDEHVYFAASFYSEFGEYLVGYTYTRLISGARMIFVVADPQKKDTLKAFINERLIKMTGSSHAATWRVYTAKERLDQADVFIASPEDFCEGNIVDQYPAFFEEASNAVFIDADKIIAMDSYVCPVIATRLHKATSGRIKFVFLSLDLLKGFAARNLPRFFCVDKVLSFSSAKENEAVSYVLWNKESKKRRIYNKSGQKLTSLEAIIAERAFDYGIDGVRLITEAPLEHADRKILSLHNVEINNLYKDIVDVNYMIYSDDRCNLSAALYACTRFRGRKKSVVHILSKPYLLREYFMSKASEEDYINRSSFIQPRVTEHAEEHKLSLLRVFCDASSEGGLTVTEFESRIKGIIRTQKEKNDDLSSVFCKKLIEEKNVDTMKVSELAAYLVAGLCDNDPVYVAPDDRDKYIRNSYGNRAKDFYLVIDPVEQDYYSFTYEKQIVFNRIKEVFTRVMACNKRVELRLNDQLIGFLDTFPSRVHLEYIVGQSIIYKNSEYEIEHIAEDGSAVYLRHENISIKNCLDTVLLRNYDFKKLGTPEKSGVLNNSKSVLQEIRVDLLKSEFVGTTYGFYSITTDRQTLDFYSGVEGNPRVEKPHVRNYKDGRVLQVTLTSRTDCTDGMRMLLSAVCNEFIRTIFPRAYHCVAICPVLAEPIDAATVSDEPIERIKTLYPYISNPSEELIETEANKIRLLIINDSREDIGVLDWFFDPAGRYMQEFLANIYSYLHWLQKRPKKNHYIYFGGEELPGCYDLDGCCELLKDFNLVFSDYGKKDFETAGDDVHDDKVERCSFCHRILESGRFSFFDKHRYICAECFDTIDDAARLNELHLQVREYLAKNYPENRFGSLKVEFDPVYELDGTQQLSEFYSRLDYVNRTLYVELDNPKNTVFVSILRSIIAMWQSDNSLSNHYAAGQLYFEEIKYLSSIGETEAADWIYNNVPSDVHAAIDEIKEFVEAKAASAEEKPENDENPEEKKGEVPAGVENRTSFSFMRQKAAEMNSDAPDHGEDEPTDEEYSDDLYDPNKIPRFWKRYLKGEHLDDGCEEVIPEEEDEDSEKEDEDSEKEEGADSENGETPDKEDENPSDPETDEDEKDNESDSIANADEARCEMGRYHSLNETIRDMCPPPETLDEELVEGDSEESSEEDGEEPESEENPEISSDEPAEKLSKKEKRKQKKEEKKQKRREKRNEKLRAWQSGLEELDEEEEKKKESEEAMWGKKKSKASTAEDEPKKKKWWQRKKKEEPVSEEKPEAPEEPIPESPDIDEPEIPEEPVPSEEPEISEDPEKEEPKKSEKKEKKEKKKAEKKKSATKKRRGKLTYGEKKVPYEEDEETNPRIKLYNELARAAYNYSEEPISVNGLPWEEVERIFWYVKFDYPELFWMHLCRGNSQSACHVFRCKDANGRLDIKQIEKKSDELRKGAKFFTKGITKRTDPYEAVLTIYRRLVLNLDYDSVGLDNKADEDLTRDDALRSLYNAIVKRKVVCAGYAVAMQYLLNSVGIVCGYVSSEPNAEGITHAFNILKIGKYCYYLDATWADSSNTRDGGDAESIKYEYFCTPYDEFQLSSPASKGNHVPSKRLFPTVERFNYTNHEYYRYHNAYVKSYNEEELVRIFAESALRYDADEMGRFTVSFRCSSQMLGQYVVNTLETKGKILEVVSKARAIVEKKKKKAAKLLDTSQGICRICYNPEGDVNPTGVVQYVFPALDTDKDKKK